MLATPPCQVLLEPSWRVWTYCQHNTVSKMSPFPASFRNDHCQPNLQDSSRLSDFLTRIQLLFLLSLALWERAKPGAYAFIWAQGGPPDPSSSCHLSSFLSLSTPAILKTRAASRDTPRKIKERQHLPTPVFAEAQQLPRERSEPRSPWAAQG